MRHIINELNQSNSTNYKLEVFKKYKDNELLQMLLSLTYDITKYSFGIKKIPSYTPNKSDTFNISLHTALITLRDTFAKRIVTGNEAIEYLTGLLENMYEDDADILCRVINRDLRINCGKTLINKVWKDLIIDPPYMRCGIYNDKTAKKISFPAILQIKADGMYQAVIVDNDNVTFTSRSGEIREFKLLEESFKTLPNGIYIGELLVKGITNRSEANGIINSDNPPQNDIYIQLWDYLTLDEYSDSKHENNNIKRFNYDIRFGILNDIITKTNTNENIKLIETRLVNNISEALKLTSEWMNDGFEGSILKDLNNIFKDHTSPTQLKLKLEIELEVRVTGFTDGTKGTKREKTFGAITYQNDEGTIIGQCSGFTDKQLDEFNSKRDELVGTIMSVMCNDITKGRDNNYYALSHPRFIEFRNDKNTTDTLEKALELKNSFNLVKDNQAKFEAMMLGDK